MIWWAIFAQQLLGQVFNEKCENEIIQLQGLMSSAILVLNTREATGDKLKQEGPQGVMGWRRRRAFQLILLPILHSINY